MRPDTLQKEASKQKSIGRELNQPSSVLKINAATIVLWALDLLFFAMIFVSLFTWPKASPVFIALFTVFFVYLFPSRKGAGASAVVLAVLLFPAVFASAVDFGENEFVNSLKVLILCEPGSEWQTQVSKWNYAPGETSYTFRHGCVSENGDEVGISGGRAFGANMLIYGTAALVAFALYRLKYLVKKNDARNDDPAPTHRR